MADSGQFVVPIGPTNINTTANQGQGNDLREDNTMQCPSNVVSSGNSPGHESSPRINDDFEFLWGHRKYLVLLGVLAVGVTYNAGLTPPGGSWTLNKDGHDAGDPVMHDGFSERYEVFFYCNAAAFAASLVLIILLLSKTVTNQRMWLHSMQLTMTLDLFSLLGAYAAGSCRAVKSSIYIWVLVFAVVIYVGIHTLVSTRFVPIEWKQELQRMINRVLNQRGSLGTQESTPLGKGVEEARKFILTLVTFAATVTYQAGLNPPGGFWAENDHGSNKVHLAFPPYKHHPATSVLRSNYLLRYKIFITSNSTSFVASLVIIILLLSPKLGGHGMRTKAVIVCVVVDLLCLIIAYAAGCCREVATSFYVVVIFVVIWISFAVLAGVFVQEPVANWLEEVTSSSLCCVNFVGRALSLNFPGHRSINAEQRNSVAMTDQSPARSTDAPAEDNTPEQQDQPADNQQHSNIREGEFHEEHAPAEKSQIPDVQEAVSNSQHPSRNSQQSANIQDVVSNPEYQSPDVQCVAELEDVSCSQHPAGNCQRPEHAKDVVSNMECPLLSHQQTENSMCGMSANQKVASMREQSSPDDPDMTALPVEQNMSGGQSNGDTSHDIVDEVLSAPVEATGNVDRAEQNNLIEDNNPSAEILGSDDHPTHSENGHTDSNHGLPIQNADNIQTEKHLNKTRTCMLLLAILAASLAYQSGLNPPGGFWSRSKDHHSAADRILEDTHHRRFIAFFYLNAIAFVASIVMVTLLLNKMVSDKFTKRRALPITMIVVLLSLTGAFALGNCREAKKTIFISVLVCSVLTYVLIHVLIAVHMIPPGWRRQVADMLEHSVSPFCSVPRQSGHSQTGADTSGKELERRRNLLLTIAIVAVTVTYQAGMNPPGGVWSDDKYATGTPGNPILQDTHPKRYDVFYYSNSVSFVSSVVVTILLVNKESCEYGIKSYALRVLLVAGLLGLLIAYVAGSCRNIKQSIYLSIIAMGVLVSLLIQVLLSSMHDTLGKPLAKCLGFLHDLLFHAESGQVNTPVSPEASVDSSHEASVDVRSEASVDARPEASVAEEKKVRKRHKYLMLLAILAASIAYQAGLNPPGGFWFDDEGHVPGNPVLHDINHRRYKIFFCFNSFAFMASIVVIMLPLSKSIRNKAVLLGVLHLIMILDMLALMTAFAAGSSRKLRTSVYVYALVGGVVVILLLLIIVSSAITKYRKAREGSGITPPRRSEPVSGANTPTRSEI
uniref:PGG domain-containing protein n=1 Tax=Hordeum vulgare subsp. vulgare TaxID=112509 RepID=A0A8I6Z1J9_HORVV